MTGRRARMRSFIMNVTSLRNTLFGIALVLVIASCSASSPSIPSGSAGPSALRAPASKALLFVSTGRQNLIQIYSAHSPHRLVGQITHGLVGPNGEAIDAAGNLYVANADGATVTVYSPGGSKPIRTYRRGLSNPLTPAIGGDGTLYISNFNSDGSGEILEYHPNQLRPFFKIPLTGGAIGVALDSSNNLYVSEYGSTGRILKFKPGSKTGKDLGISLSFAGRLIVDQQGNIIVCDQGAPAVDVFPPGATQPSQQIKGGFVDPFALALNKTSSKLYVADGAGNDVYIYSYPSLNPAGTINRGATSFGLAIYPSAPL
jgi:DNA-binding beta-propeller fold protein YncE